MKKIINYTTLLISILCLPVGYVVAGGNSLVASQDSWLLADGTTAGWFVVGLE